MNLGKNIDNGTLGDVLYFHHPSTMLIAGPTGSGKTHFLTRLLKHNLFSPSPDKIIWVYGEKQALHDEMAASLQVPIEFFSDFDDNIYDSIDGSQKVVVILDDQMMNDSVRKKDNLAKYFTQGSHHRNMSIIYLVQNVFDKAKCMRTISLNSQYLVVFKNPRDMQQITSLASQMYGTNSQVLKAAFRDATAKPHGYLLVDLRQETPDNMRLRTNIFPDDADGVVIYEPV